MGEAGFRAFVADTLRLVERDAPQCARAMREALGGRRVQLDVGRDAMALVTVGGRIALGATDEATDEAVAVRIVATEAAICALVEGRCSLLEAVERAAVELLATVDDAVAVDAALRHLVAGAVRSPSMPARWARYRAEVARRARSAAAAVAGDSR